MANSDKHGKTSSVGATLSHRIVGFYRGWSNYIRLRKGAEASYWVVVDDLCKAAVELQSFDSEVAVAAALDALIAECETHPEALGSTHRARYTQEKLRQSRIFLTDQMAAQDIPAEVVHDLDFECYGVPYIDVTDVELGVLRHRASQLRSFANDALARQGVDPRVYFEVSLSTDAAAVRMRAMSERWLARFQNAYEQLILPGFDCVPQALDAPFQNLVVFNNSRIQLLLNRHAEAAFTPAHVDFLALHEICGHIQHFTQLLADSEMQSVAPHLLCFNLHNLDAFVLEGVAQVMSVLALDALGGEHPEVEAQLASANLFVATRHANLVGLLRGSLDLHTAVERHVTILGGSKAGAEAIYRGKLANRHGAVQALNYYLSFALLSPFLDLDIAHRRTGLTALMRDYPTAMTAPAMLAEYANGET